MANRFWDNPVASHAARLGKGSGRPWAVILLLTAAALLGLLFHRLWMGLPEYSFLRPALALRLFALALLAETVLALPWAAVRGTFLWRRLREDGHLAEYQRSRMSAWSITLGTAAAVLSPVGTLLGVSLGLSLLGSALARSVTVDQVLTVHLLLAVQCLSFGALGLWLAARLRSPGLAIPISLGLLALAIGAIGLIDPFYRAMGDPAKGVYLALLPNPVTAVGAVLQSDVLRFAWTYEHLHANEYFYQYPPAWQTAGLYLAGAAAALAMTVRRLARSE